MSSSATFDAFLLVATFLVATVFGELLVFSVVVMPGIGKLPDGDFLRAFQVIDGIVQANQPVFVAIWIGAVITLTVTMGLGWSELIDERRVGLLISWISYMVTQATTFGINVPMNNRIKHLQIAYLDSSTKQAERERFEGSWCSWNWFRVIIMGFVSFYLMYLLLVEG
jgi:uncharacterized membrane protein